MYTEYKNSKYWEKISNLLKDLEKNNDLKLQTSEDYIVGYIVKNLEDDN